jgi:hypothetical protein
MRVNPLQLMPLPENPYALFVIDPVVRDSLSGLPVLGQKDLDHRSLLDRFLEDAQRAWPELRIATNRHELESRLAIRWPDLMYWLCHGGPEALKLGDEKVTLDDLSNLLAEFPLVGRTNGLVILNACGTAMPAKGFGSFLRVFYRAGYCGIIATEEQTIDHFANLFGIEVLRGLLDPMQPVGRLTWHTRGRHVPLGILYGTYCPPDLTIGTWPMRLGSRSEHEPLPPARHDSVASPGSMVDERESHEDSGVEERQRWLELPADRPYLPLEMYGPEHRALFAGRDSDIAQFAALLGQPTTRVLVLHGESGVGKSSFLRAGVIPFLEDECVGFRFFSKGKQANNTFGSGTSAVFIRATNDPVGQLAQELWAYCNSSPRYRTPTGQDVIVQQPDLLPRMLGISAELYPTIADTRAAFLAEPARICEVLKAIAAELPFSLILVLDQAEEMFTLVGSDGNAGSSGEPRLASRDAMLEALRRLALQPSDIKVIASLRTEFCGRLLAHLRRGASSVPGIREYMLTDLEQEALVQAIGRPTLDTPLRYGGQVPFETYGFRYGEGVARTIALESRSVGQRDSVLPLVQFLCDQLYHLVKGRSDPTVTVADFQAIGGVKGGLRSHIEKQIKIVTHDDYSEAEALKSLLHRLVHRQLDGTLSTDLVREEDLRSRWSGRRAFQEIIESAERMRLIRFNSRRRDDGSEERSLVDVHGPILRLRYRFRKTSS